MAVSSTIEGQLSDIGSSEQAIVTRKRYNLSIWGTFVATIELQRSFDDGATWLVAKQVTTPFEGVGIEVEAGVLYRVSVVSYTSGIVNYRLGLTNL